MNKLINIITLEGTTSGAGLSEDFTFSGGTQLNKMFSFVTYTGVWDPVIATVNLQVPKGSQLINANTLRIYNGVTPNQVANFRAHILCFSEDSDLVVHRVNGGALAPGVSTNIAIPVISGMSQTFWVPHGFTRIVSNNPASTVGHYVTFRLGGALGVDPTVFDVRIETNGANASYCELVDWNNADIRVQHFFRRSTVPAIGTLVYDYTDTDVAYLPVDPDQAFVIVPGGAISGGGGPATPQARDYNARFTFEAGGTILRESFDQHRMRYQWVGQVIEDVSPSDTVFRVRRPDTDIAMGAADLEGSAAVTPGVSFATLPVGTTMGCAGYCGTSNDATNDVVDNMQCHADVQGVSASMERGNTRGATIAFGQLQLVDWFTFDGNVGPESSIAPVQSFQPREGLYQGGGRRR